MFANLGLFALCLSSCDGITNSGHTVHQLDAEAHFEASWSPDGQKIAFVAQLDSIGGIYVIDTNGTNLRRVVAGPVFGTTWSPDGEWIASSWNGTIFKVRVTGDSVTFLGDKNDDFNPQWSPQGDLVAFDRTICDPACGAFIVSSSGGPSTKVEGFNPPPGYTWGRYPSWSNDPSRLYVAAIRWSSGIQIGHSFYFISLDSMNARQLVSFDTKDDARYPKVDPSGKYIAYSRRPPGKYSQVWKVNIETGQQFQLTSDAGTRPCWSPDGRMIVYTRATQEDGALWIMNSDGSGKRRLTKRSN